MSVEAKELKTCRSLVEANYAAVKSDDCFTLKSNDSLHFHTSSLPVEANNSKSVPFGPADSSVESGDGQNTDPQSMDYPNGLP